MFHDRKQVYPTPSMQSLSVARLVVFHAITSECALLSRGLRNTCATTNVFVHVWYWFSFGGTLMQTTKPSMKRGKQRTLLLDETLPGLREVGAMARHPDLFFFQILEGPWWIGPSCMFEIHFAHAKLFLCCRFE